MILSDELAGAVHRKLSLGAESFGRRAKDRRRKAYRAELYPKVVIRPVCGCCGNPMILGRSPHLQGDHLVEAGQQSPGGEVIIPLAYKRGGGQRRTEDDGQ